MKLHIPKYSVVMMKRVLAFVVHIPKYLAVW